MIRRWLILLLLCTALCATLVLLGSPVWRAAAVVAFGVLIGLTARFNEPDSNEPPQRWRRG